MLASRSPRTHVVFPCSPQPPAYHILSTFASNQLLRLERCAKGRGVRDPVSFRVKGTAPPRPHVRRVRHPEQLSMASGHPEQPGGGVPGSQGGKGGQTLIPNP